jgi:hypothetical protein
MRFVGLFAVVVGVLSLLIAILVVVAVYRDRVPADWQAKTKEYYDQVREKLPDDVRKQADQYSLDKLPSNDHLWGIALNAAVVGLFYLLMGSWTRSAGGAFRKIVDTRGNDISNLMNGLAALHRMYSLVYMLLIITLLCGIISLGLTLYKSFSP